MKGRKGKIKEGEGVNEAREVREINHTNLSLR